MVTIVLTAEERDLLIQVIGTAEAQCDQSAQIGSSVTRAVWASYAKTLKGVRQRLLVSAPGQQFDLLVAIDVLQRIKNASGSAIFQSSDSPELIRHAVKLQNLGMFSPSPRIEFSPDPRFRNGTKVAVTARLTPRGEELYSVLARWVLLTG